MFGLWEEEMCWISKGELEEFVMVVMINVEDRINLGISSRARDGLPNPRLVSV